MFWQVIAIIALVFFLSLLSLLAKISAKIEKIESNMSALLGYLILTIKDKEKKGDAYRDTYR